MDGMTFPTPERAGPTSRSDRMPLLAFIGDAESEAVLHEGLAGVMPRGFEVRRGNVRTALHDLGQMTTPKALVIDITGEPQALALLADLRHVVEPDVKVLIVGERQDVTFYRQVTRSLGAAEYLYKPLMPEMVARHFGAQLNRGTTTADGGGRMVCLTGVRGGAGTTTLTANLAWYIAEVGRRNTILLDADLHTGTAAMLLGGRTGPGLRAALEAPDRMDELFIERSAMPVSDRLHILAAEEPLTERPGYLPGAAERLTSMLRRRFNYVLADVPFHGGPFAEDLLLLTQQRVLVLLPTLGSVRDTLRMLTVPAGTGQVRRAVLVLNRTGMPGGLPRAAVEDALDMAVDVCIPDLPKTVGMAESLGEPAVRVHGGFRTGIIRLAREMGFVGSDAAVTRRWWRR
jgi:pilus assembly protein CpaE